MKSKTPFIILFSFLLLSFLAFSAAVFFLEKNRVFKSAPFSEPEKTAPSAEAPFVPAEPQFLEGTFSGNQGSGEVPTQVQVSLQGAKGGKAIQLSWDESKVAIFHIVLLNTEWRVIWLLSSLDSGVLPEGGKSINRKDISLFVPSGYVVGDRIDGFQSLDEQQKFELTPGGQYYLQMFGFTKEDQNIAVNKKFTFTGTQ